MVRKQAIKSGRKDSVAVWTRQTKGCLCLSGDGLCWLLRLSSWLSGCNETPCKDKQKNKKKAISGVSSARKSFWIVIRTLTRAGCVTLCVGFLPAESIAKWVAPHHLAVKLQTKNQNKADEWVNILKSIPETAVCVFRAVKSYTPWFISTSLEKRWRRDPR